ncbi:unnamed protein product [Calypogeia fissa]
MLKWSGLHIMSSTASAHDFTIPPDGGIYISFQIGLYRRLTSNLVHRVGFWPNAGFSTSFWTCDHNGSTDVAGKSERVRVTKEDGSVKISLKRRFRSRNRNCGCSRFGRQGSTTVQCSEEGMEVSPDEEDRNSRASEKSFPGTERTSNKARGRTATGQSLEVRLLQRLNSTLKDRHLLGPGQKVLLAVSGGQDSVCLMHLLVKLQSRWGWKIGIAHCDHQWSSSARQQAAHVAQMAQGLGLDYYQALTVEAVPGEGVARTWRYGVLQRIAVSHRYEAIVTAHTASDRIETSLFNIFRGSGLQGLQSLTWKRSLSPGLSLSCKSAFQLTKPVESLEDPLEGTVAISKSSISLIRPLLDVTRTELRELREELTLPLWPDPSNTCVDIDRNRIRHELLPYLRKHFNSGVDKSLARWAEILHGEQAYLDCVCDSITAIAVSEIRGPGGEEVGRKLNISLLESVPIALQRRILKQFSDGFTRKSLGFDIVERVRQGCGDLSSRKKGLKVSVPGNCYLFIRDDDLTICRCPDRRIQN